jgi:hypothetical protein
MDLQDLEDAQRYQMSPTLAIAELAKKIAHKYPTDCEQVKTFLKERKAKLMALIMDARQRPGNGWDKLLLSRQELRLAQAEWERAVGRYRTDCLTALRNRRY